MTVLFFQNLSEGTSYLTTVMPANKKGVGKSVHVIVDTLRHPAVELTQVTDRSGDAVNKFLFHGHLIRFPLFHLTSPAFFKRWKRRTVAKTLTTPNRPATSTCSGTPLRSGRSPRASSRVERSASPFSSSPASSLGGRGKEGMSPDGL